MHLQLVSGQAGDAEALVRQCRRWEAELAPGAAGWLGSSGGVTSDGRFALAFRFASAEGARASTRRPEHQAWWSDTRASLDGAAHLVETDDVTAVGGADPAPAGFVQMMRSRVQDRGRFEAVEARIAPAFVSLRPDFVCGFRAWFPDGTLAAVDHFRSEAEARAGEAMELPDEVRAGHQEWLSLLEGTEWLDFSDPFVAQPAER